MSCQAFNPSLNSPIVDFEIICAAFSETNFNSTSFPTPNVTDNNASKVINTAEALFSFNTQLSPDGIFMSLKTFQSTCKGYLSLLKPCNHFLQIVTLRIPTPEAVDSPKMMEDVNNSSQGQPEPKRLAIGVEGGFDGRGFTEETKYYLATINEADGKLYHCELSLCPNQHAQNLVSYIIAATSVDTQEISAWEGDVREVDENLLTYPQQPVTLNEDGTPNYPDLTKCCILDCDKKDNLWINLGTGFVGCGRKYYDGTGGNNHGIEHFQKEGDAVARYSIKIGTISSNLDAIDIYDMKDDKFVKDPIIIDHLKHWGIDPYKMSKTEKTITEMEIDLNKKFGNEWDIIQEKGKDLKPAENCFGIENLGSTCYLSAVCQALLQLPQIKERFCDRQQYHNYIFDKLKTCDLNDPKTFQNFLTDPEFQTRKLFSSLSHGPIADLGEHVNIRPLQFKINVGENHPEFKLWSQQDSLEWMQHFFDFLDRKCKNEGNPSKFFKVLRVFYLRKNYLQNNKYIFGIFSILVFHFSASLSPETIF